MKRSLVILAATGLSIGAANAEESAPKLNVPPPQVMEEVVVLGKFVPDEKRNTSEVSNVLDQEAMALIADSAVGDALIRVTGISLVGGKYVYVRGLGERYSSTLLDGTRLSSPVPFQKTVPLDIVPNSIVQNLLVQKTYSPQYPGDFSGGVVMIRTKATPEENYLSVKLQAAGNSETTGATGCPTTVGLTTNGAWMTVRAVFPTTSSRCPASSSNPPAFRTIGLWAQASTIFGISRRWIVCDRITRAMRSSATVTTSTAGPP
ncbi:MAG: TonB-dependent receptor plug domain-containing protein [Pseudomonadales bacterium]